MNCKEGTGITIFEYHNGALVREWYELHRAAAYHHVRPELIKELICSGNPLPTRSLDGANITFDLDPECNWDIIETPSGGYRCKCDRNKQPQKRKLKVVQDRKSKESAG